MRSAWPALTGLRIVAVGDVLMHARSRKPLQDALTATRLRCTVADAGHRWPQCRAHLRSRARLAALYRPEWLAATLECWPAAAAFSLDELRYEYPREIVPAGHTPTSWLRAADRSRACAALFPQGGRRRCAR
jgi:error-prone DNA polymerase